MILQKIVFLLRSYIDEPGEDASDWDDATELVPYINQENDFLCSILRGRYEDYSGREYTKQCEDGVKSYYLPYDFLALRRVEIINGGVSGTFPNLVVDEQTASISEIHQVDLNGKNYVNSLRTTRGFRADEGYYIWNNQIRFTPQTNLTDAYFRLFYTPQSCDLHYGTAQDADTDMIVLADNDAATTYGVVSPIDNYYQDAQIQITDGTGKGQRRIITKYDGATQAATVHEPWTVMPDTTSVYSMISNIPENYHELLALGAAMRAKGIKTEDDTSEIANIYSGRLSDFKASLEMRNQSQSRRVISSTRSSWF